MKRIRIVSPDAPTAEVVAYAQAIIRSLDLISDLDVVRSRAVVRNRGALARVRARVRDVVRDGELVRVLDLVSVRDLDRVRDRVSVLEHALDRAGTFGLVIDNALDRVRALKLALDGALDPDLVRALDYDLERGCVAAQRLVSVLAPKALKSAIAPAPGRMAARLAHGAVRVLPANSQCRYRDEFDSELYELATAGASWWEQVMYGLRLIDRAWVLRAELREVDARGRAVPS